MPFSRGRQHRSRSPKRLVQWDAGPQAGGLGVSATGATLWTQGVVLVSEPNTTIVRIRGYASILLLSAAAAGDGFKGALAMGVASTTAFTAGVASLPSPLTEPEWSGWIYYQMFDVRAITATIADGVNGPGATFKMNIDTKAMRKFRADETLFGSIEVVESGTATAELNADTRALLKLP